MKRLLNIIILILTIAFSVVNGQTGRTDNTSVIENLFTRLVKSTNDVDKIRINDSIVLFIDSYARSDSVFDHSFNELRYFGQVTSRRAGVKILTWNLLLFDSPSRYYSYFIFRPERENVIYKLSGTYTEQPVRTDTIYTNENWYGALYYDLRHFRQDNQTWWILLGIDYGNPSVTRKIIDVLSIGDDSSLVFGKKIFKANNELKYREVLEYSSEAVASLKFGSDKTIVFDHLVPMSPALRGQKEFYGPDFSLDAYNLEDGIWKLEENVDIRNKR